MPENNKEKENYNIKELYFDFKDFKRELHLDFKEFKIEIKEYLSASLKENFDRILFYFKLGISVLIGLVTVFCFVFVYVFDNRLNDTKEYNQARMEKLEQVLFSLASDDFIERIDQKRKLSKKKRKKNPARYK